MASLPEEAGEAAELEVPEGDGEVPEEVWRRRGRQRQRQIDIGKARPEYQNMRSARPTLNQPPQTPDPHARISKRAFDRQLSTWRRRLHEFDEGPVCNASCTSPENVPYALTPSTRADSEELSPALNLNLHDLLPPAQAIPTHTTTCSGPTLAPRWTGNAGATSPLQMAAILPAQMIRPGQTAGSLQSWPTSTVAMRTSQPAMMPMHPSYLWASCWPPNVAAQQPAHGSLLAAPRTADAAPTAPATGSFAAEAAIPSSITCVQQGGLLLHCQEAPSPQPTQPVVAVSAAPWPPATWGGLAGGTAGDSYTATARAESPTRPLTYRAFAAETPQRSQTVVDAQAAAPVSSRGSTSPSRPQRALSARPQQRASSPAPEVAPNTPPKKQFGTAPQTPQNGSPTGSGALSTPSPQRQMTSPQRQVETPSPQQQASSFRLTAMTPGQALGMTPVAASHLPMVTSVHWRGPMTPVTTKLFYVGSGGITAGSGLQCLAGGTPVVPFAASPGDFHMCRPATYIQTPAPAPPQPASSASPPVHRHHGATHGLTPGPSRVSLCGEDTVASMAEWRRPES